MRYQTLGDSGLMVSAVGLGLNNVGYRIDREQTRAVLDTAAEVGITLLDTADSYGFSAGPGASERIVGEVLKGRRDDFVLATKFGSNMSGLNGNDFGARGSRRYIRRAVEGSLQRLQTDYIDLYQYHRPDNITPIAETLAALHELVQEGKIRYIGSSNFSGWQVADAAWTAETSGLTSFISEQSEYSLARREIEREVVPAAERFGVDILPYFPLASGVLTGKVGRDRKAPKGSRLEGNFAGWLTDEAFDLVDGLGAYAKARDLSLLEVAVGGLAAQPAVGSVIAGATSPEQVRQNAAAADWEPTLEDLAELDKIAPPGVNIPFSR
ncbi:aldo/keto reductase [Fodinicola feengrottensis]|uniref:Aldo/keto reductase n=1 Tax=Fodinicola feengrottensis TaxID=435914 RepID=A0ABN2GSM0_9ACTN|nr:aldo/keto reductase [Fodinicola feengrottensis]